MSDHIEQFRTAGRLMALGLKVKPPRLPRTPQELQEVRRAAKRDPHVRRALKASERVVLFH